VMPRRGDPLDTTRLRNDEDAAYAIPNPVILSDLSMLLALRHQRAWR